MEAYMVEVTARLKAIWHEGRIAFLGHVGDGNLHIAIGAGGPEYRKKVEGCVYEPLRGIGGSVSAEHGIGLEKKAWFLITRNAQERARSEEHTSELQSLMRISYAVFCLEKK